VIRRDRPAFADAEDSEEEDEVAREIEDWKEKKRTNENMSGHSFN
jgi:hypothetical protein